VCGDGFTNIKLVHHEEDKPEVEIEEEEVEA
jgi:hypothetical protein